LRERERERERDFVKNHTFHTLSYIRLFEILVERMSNSSKNLLRKHDENPHLRKDAEKADDMEEFSLEGYLYKKSSNGTFKQACTQILYQKLYLQSSLLILPHTHTHNQPNRMVAKKMVRDFKSIPDVPFKTWRRSTSLD
jgi:hypothetical protein